MRFDQTYIAIRTRGILEIMDLSLHVIRDHFRPLSLLWLCGVLPFALANWYATRWMTTDYFEFEYLTLYFFTVSFLVINQAQVATTFMTTYLGQAMFSQKPSVWEAIKQTLKVNPWFIWFHGFYRCAILVYATVLMMGENMKGDTFGLVYTLFVILVLIGLLVRLFRPFASEILLLERTPVRAKQQDKITYKIRSSGLHGTVDSDLTGRFAMLTLFAFLLAGSFMGSMMLVDSWLNLHAADTSIPALIYLPIALWMVAGVYAVVRFLSYIDIRIRQEGWEVELRMKSESMRIQKAAN